MKNSDLIITVLEPTKAENWLTNGETFSKKVYLGKNDSPDNWHEIIETEKLELEQQGGDEE